METRSRQGEKVDPEALADWPLIESTGTRRSVLRDLAAKYSVTVRREASIIVVREQLLRHFAMLGFSPAAAPSGRSSPPASASPAMPASSSPVAASSSPVVAAQQRPAAQQRSQQPADTQASASAAMERSASAPHDVAPCTQQASISQRATHPAQSTLLQELADAREQTAEAHAEMHRLSAHCSELQAALAVCDARIARLESQATPSQ
jgi:hypothetical protein